MTRETGSGKETTPTYLDEYSLGSISDELLAELRDPLGNPYHNGHMYEDLLEDIEGQPEIFRLLAARLNDSPNRLVGVSVVETKPHDFIDYKGFDPIHVKRFTVLREFRRMGIASQLMKRSKDFAFEESGQNVLFGESNELGALAFYGQRGAMYHLDSVRHALRRTPPEKNIGYFIKFITDPAFEDFRYPVGDGIPFVYCKDDATTKFFQANGYIAKDELLDTYGSVLQSQ